MVFYALITNTITLGHFTLANFKWQISQNSRNVKNHWDFNLDQIILTRRVGRIFTFSCYKIKYQIIKLRNLTFCNSQLNFPDQNIKKVRNSKFKIQTLLQVQVFCLFYILMQVHTVCAPWTTRTITYKPPRSTLNILVIFYWNFLLGGSHL